MGQVISMSAARRERAIRRANEKVRKEEERNQQRQAAPAPQKTNAKLAQALEKYGSFSGNQMKKKEKPNGDIQS